jgi:type IV secretory pathway VirB4 component
MKQKENENPVIAHLKLLKKHGRLDEKAISQAIDALSEPENHNLLKEYLEEQSVELADIVLNGKPFPLPDETADGPIRFAITENSRFIGLYPEECHVLIAGQTGTGKSTLLKIIFAQALLINDRERQGNGENNLLAIR